MKHLVIPALVLAYAAPAGAADIRHGQALHEAHCIRCHADLAGGDGSGLYTRAERLVGNLPGLEKQVRFCRDNLGLTWFDEDVEDVSAFLNARYYRFQE